MRDVREQLLAAWAAGETVALATVVETFRSAPRPAGATMVRLADGSVVGSVSGGCVEGAVHELAGEVIDTGVARSERYGISADSFAVGLTCGGVLDLFVEPVSQRHWPGLDEVIADIDAERPVAVATIIDHPKPDLIGRRLVVRPDSAAGDLGPRQLTAAVADDARGMLDLGETSTRRYGAAGERMGNDTAVFVAAFAPRPRMIVFGAIDFAAAVARQGDLLGYHVTVCDARSLFATEARFPTVDDLVVDWPHRYLRAELDAGKIDARTVICVLTHDPKFDVPVLQVAFDAPEGVYIGAMGSRHTHADRLRRLREAGVSDAQLARLHSPIGIDLGARTPEETAVSIAAEFISVRWGGRGQRLSTTSGAIHRVATTTPVDPAWSADAR